jgi:hypothetical protein
VLRRIGGENLFGSAGESHLAVTQHETFVANLAHQIARVRGDHEEVGLAPIHSFINTISGSMLVATAKALRVCMPLE